VMEKEGGNVITKMRRNITAPTPIKNPMTG